MRNVIRRLSLVVALSLATLVAAPVAAAATTATTGTPASVTRTIAADVSVAATWHHWGNFVDPNRCHEMGRQLVDMGLAQTYKCQRFPAPPFVAFALWIWF